MIWSPGWASHGNELVLTTHQVLSISGQLRSNEARRGYESSPNTHQCMSSLSADLSHPVGRVC